MSCVVRSAGDRKHGPKPYFCCHPSRRPHWTTLRPLQVRPTDLYIYQPEAPARPGIASRCGDTLLKASTSVTERCTTAAKQVSLATARTWSKVCGAFALVSGWLVSKRPALPQTRSTENFTMHKVGSGETLVNPDVETGKMNSNMEKEDGKKVVV